MPWTGRNKMSWIARSSHWGGMLSFQPVIDSASSSMLNFFFILVWILFYFTFLFYFCFYFFFIFSTFKKKEIPVIWLPWQLEPLVTNILAWLLLCFFFYTFILIFNFYFFLWFFFFFIHAIQLPKELEPLITNTCVQKRYVRQKVNL